MVMTRFLNASPTRYPMDATGLGCERPSLGGGSGWSTEERFFWSELFSMAEIVLSGRPIPEEIAA